MASVNYSWNNLPSVVIYDVFQLLTNKQDLLNASSTCKNWRSCIFHPKLWPIKSITIDLVNISAYESKNTNASTNGPSTSRGHFSHTTRKSHYHLKSDPYRRQNHNNNTYKNQYYSSNSKSNASTKRFFSYQQRLNERLNSNGSRKRRQFGQIGNTLNDNTFNNSNYDLNNNLNNLNNNFKDNSNVSKHQLLIKNNSNFYGQNAHLKADYKQFLERCSRFLSSVTVVFNAYDHRQLAQLIYTINILIHSRSKYQQASSSIGEYEINHFNNIESLILKPIYIKTLDKSSNQLVNRTNHFTPLRTHNRLNKRNYNELLLKVFDAIEKLISTNRSIKNLSLGCLEELLDYLPSLLNKLKNNLHVNELVESLNLATIKVDPFYYPVHDVKFTWFTSFKNLIKLSIDYDYVSDDFIIQLANNCKKLKDLTLNIHGLDKYHPIVTSNAWNSFKQINDDEQKCEVELSINLLHTNESPNELKLILQNITIPITSFRAYFAYSSFTNDNQTESPLKSIIEIISIQQHSNLKQLTLVDELKQNDLGILEPNTTFSSMEENTLVMLAWRCRNLEELTLIGKLSASFLFLNVLIFIFLFF